MSPDRYAGLPADLAPPLRTAQAIAALDEAGEREVLLARVPPQWRDWIAELAVVAIAARIVATPGVENRRRMVAEVPAPWRADVTQHVRRLWHVEQMRMSEAA